MIHVVHTINAFTATTGGTATCTYDLMTALNNANQVKADILVTHPQQPLMGKGETWIKAVNNDEKTAFGLSCNLRKALEQTNADIYHTNGLWRYCNHVTAVVAREKDRPFVLTPHGMLYPQALVRSKWQKRLLRAFLFDRDIREAACIHVTCKQEMQHVRNLGFTNPIAVIGNPIPMPPKAVQKLRIGKIRFGFLGRLHPIKQVELLIDALSGLSQQEQAQCELVIMGSGELAYEQSLRERVRSNGLINVQFTGFVCGEEKQRRLAELTALFVPSETENFGMIIAEALRQGTPVWASTGTPWEILQEKGCGWWQEPTPQHMTDVMRKILSLNPEVLDKMGRIGQQLVAEYFSDTVVAQQMAELYQWILTKQNKPSFVYE